MNKISVVTIAMLMAASLTVVGCGTPSAGNISRQISYSSYHNSVFNFSAEYPSNWTESKGSQDGSGRSFITSSGISSYNNGRQFTPHSDVVLTVLGIGNATMGAGQGLTFHQMVGKFKKYFMSESTKSDVIHQAYKVVPGKYIIEDVETKVGDNALTYTRTYISLKADNTISMTFPKSQRSLYVPIWRHITSTFVFGDTPG
ncbi:MAG: hypothetical protein ACYCVB_13680 [Bacilli bacterium]